MGNNTIINGVNTLSADLAGKTVSEVRSMLAQALNIDAAAVATVDGVKVNSNYVLEDGNELEFIKPSGEKGAGF